MRSFENKEAIVTGGGGIGRAPALAHAKKGASVAENAVTFNLSVIPVLIW
ncbi:hypothetical protein [Bacillus marinisedimentorum]|nr:hypothetical protein [Bacillus marinisedimentorum]